MKNNFPFRPHWKKPEEPKAAPETSQYLPRAVELTVEQHKPEEGLRVLLEGFAHYFNCTAEALGPYPLADTAMLIVLYCRDFTFTWDGPDSCDCAFNIKGRGYDEIQTVNLNFSK